MSADDLIQELRAGLEGVTPGLWGTRPTAEGMGDTFITAPSDNARGWRSIAIVHPQKQDSDAAHIARCSPDNIRTLLDALAAKDAAAQTELVLVRKALEPFAKALEALGRSRFELDDRENIRGIGPDLAITIGDLRNAAQLSKALTCTDHTLAPAGYLAWHDWAKRMSRTHRQVRCAGCGLYAIWIPKARAAPLPDSLHKEGETP